MTIQIIDIDTELDVMADEAAEMYNELVAAGEDPIDAAWLVDEHFGFTSGYDDYDPMAPDWNRLADDAEGEHWRHDAEGEAVQ